MASLGAEVLGVPVDDQGLVVEAIPPRTRLVYVTPSHQFPLGMAMSLPRRLALLAWAERHDAAVVEDDYDSEFRYGGRPIEPLQTLDGSGRVIYVGSFSKTLLPTLRLGFLVVPASLVAAVRRAKFLADWHTPLPTQAALADLIDQGYFARHLRKMRATYQQRHQQIVESLDDRFADHLKPVPSAAGLHVAATAPASTPEELRAVLGRASAAGVEVQPLSMFDVGQPSQPGIVLGYGTIHRRYRGGPEPAPALLRRLTRSCRPGLAWSTPSGIGSRSSPLSVLCSGVTLHNLPRRGKEAWMREAIEERPEHDQAGARPAAPARPRPGSAEVALLIVAVLILAHQLDHVLRADASGWPFTRDLTWFTASLLGISSPTLGVVSVAVTLLLSAAVPVALVLLVGDLARFRRPGRVAAAALLVLVLGWTSPTGGPGRRPTARGWPA